MALPALFAHFVRRLASLAVLVAVPVILPAQQTASVSGRITIAGSPASDVTVYLRGTTRGTSSDADGRYRITSIPAGAYALVAQRIGTTTRIDSLVLAAGEARTMDLALEASASVIAPMSVSATRELRRRDEGSATIELLDGAEVRRTRAAHPSGLMNRIPGVHVSDLSGEGHSMAIRQPITTKPMYLYLEDGIPTRATGFFNHNALYEVNIPQSAGIEVLKGPGTALYGSDAIGGVVNVLTRPAPLTPSGEVSVEGGQYGYGRLMVSGGFTRGASGFRGDINATTSENWKDAAPFRRQSATLRWDLALPGWTARTVLTGSNIEQQDVPALTTTQFQTTRALNLAPIAYREVQALRLSSAIEHDMGTSHVSVTPYARINAMRLLPSWQLSYDPQTWETNNTSLGIQTKYRRDFAPLEARLILGADAEQSPGDFLAQRANVVRSGPNNAYASFTPGATHYDYDVTYSVASPYVHAEFTPVRGLRVDAGLRGDFSGYEYASRLAPLDTGAHRRPANTSRSYAHVSPKVGATYTLSPSVSLFGSYRHGFRAPSQGQLFQQNSAANTVDLEPVRVDAYETGLRGQLGRRAAFQLSVYDMTIRDDIITYITAQNRREAINAGRTRHRGVELGVGLALTTDLRLDLGGSVARQVYVEWTPQSATATASAVSYSGNRIETAPSSLGNALLTYSPSLLRGGRVAFELSHTGGYATDPANTHSYGGHALMNLHLNANVTPRVELFGRLSNLTDRAYAEIMTYDAFQKDQITPGAPRSVYLGMKTAW